MVQSLTEQDFWESFMKCHPDQMCNVPVKFRSGQILEIHGRYINEKLRRRGVKGNINNIILASYVHSKKIPKYGVNELAYMNERINA